MQKCRVALWEGSCGRSAGKYNANIKCVFVDRTEVDHD
jgi:hypothetical protein